MTLTRGRTSGSGGGTGPEGPEGDSAYQVWLDAGNTGSEADFLASLVGPQGVPGVPGSAGSGGGGSSLAMLGVPNAGPVLTYGRPGPQNTYTNIPVGEQGGVGRTGRFAVKPGVKCTDLRLVFTGTEQQFGSSGGSAAGFASAFTYKAAWEYDGRTYPVTVNGKRTFDVDPWGLVVTDPVGIVLERGELAVLRVWTATQTGTIYYGSMKPNGPSHYGISFSTSYGWTQGDVVDATGAMANGFSANSPGATYVIGRHLEERPCLAAVGDSITAAEDDWLVRAVNGTYPVIQIAANGMRALDYSKPGGGTYSKPWLDGFTAAAVMLGTNDFAQAGVTLTSLAPWLVALWKQIAARGLATWACTLPPRTTSTDAYVTTANQTVNASDAVRVGLNTWLRAGAPLDPTTLTYVPVGTGGAVLAGAADHPLRGYFDTADTVESARNSGKWANVSGVALTGDGLHPSDTGQALMAAAVNVPAMAAA